MRRFIVIGHDAATSPDFTLDDLPGSAGRLDVLCRCVNSAFLRSHGIREQVRLHCVLQDAVTVTFDGADLRYVNPDERSTAALFQRALERLDAADGDGPHRTTPGITVQRRGLDGLLDAVDGTVVTLRRDGEPLGDATPPEDPVYVLSDHHDFTEDDQAVLDRHAAQRVSVGPVAVHADHTITVVHNWHDTDGYTRYRSDEPA